MSIETEKTPQTITLHCTDCGARRPFPNKGFGRIGAHIFRQDHTCPAPKDIK